MIEEVVEYKLENGDYILYLDGIKKHNLGKNVALSYSFWIDQNGNECGTVYSVSDIEQIKELHLNKVKQLSLISGNDNNLKLIAESMLNSLYYRVVTPDIEELNALIHNSTYIIGYHKKINDIDLDCLSFELYKSNLTIQSLYDFCKELRHKDVPSSDIINVISEFMKIYRDELDESKEIVLEEALDALTGFCSSQHSLA